MFYFNYKIADLILGDKETKLSSQTLVSFFLLKHLFRRLKRPKALRSRIHLNVCFVQFHKRILKIVLILGNRSTRGLFEVRGNNNILGEDGIWRSFR